MPNHVRLIAVPEAEDGLRRAIGEANRRYTRYINFQKGWKGHLWQGRFVLFPMDEHYLIAAARYIELNPVRARIAKKPENWQWSSARAHLQKEDDILVKAGPLLDKIPDWGNCFPVGCLLRSARHFGAMREPVVLLEAAPFSPSSKNYRAAFLQSRNLVQRKSS